MNLAGGTLGAIIGGTIIQNEGFNWTFIIGIVFLCVYITVLFLFVPETGYRRAAIYESDIAAHGEVVQNNTFNKSSSDGHAASAVEVERAQRYTDDESMSFLDSLKLYRGNINNDGILASFIRCLSTIFLPATIWATFGWGSANVWLVLFVNTLPQLFTPP